MNFNKKEAVLIMASVLELRGSEGLIKILGKEKFNSLLREIDIEIHKADKQEYVLHNISFLNKCAELILTK